MAHTTAFPKSFNLYYGFGDALEVLDDRELLASMANLKQRALSPKRAAEAGLDRAREEEEQGGSSNFAPAPPVNSRPQSAAPRKGTQGRPSRPSSAPPKRPQQQPAQGAASSSADAEQQQQQQGREAADGSDSGDADLAAGYSVPPPSFQQVMERRERFMREEEALRRRELQRLEKRWEEADALVEAKREQVAQEARARVEQWSSKKTGGRARLEKDNARRLDSLTTDLLKKEERLRRYRERCEREEREKREEHARMRSEAAQRFATGVKERVFRLAEAEARVAKRVGAMAALRRQELAERAERADAKAVANLQLRMRQETALEAKIRATDEKSKRRAKDVDEFLIKQRRDHEAKVEARRAQGKGGADGQSPRGQGLPQHQMGTPRGGGGYGSGGSGSRPGSARGKKAAHMGETGLEVLPVKCALCEQSFATLAGVTFLKAVATQRAKFGDDSLLRWCTRRGLTTMYESASLCTFCCQFFQEGWRQPEASW